MVPFTPGPEDSSDEIAPDLTLALPASSQASGVGHRLLPHLEHTHLPHLKSSKNTAVVCSEDSKMMDGPLEKAEDQLHAARKAETWIKNEHSTKQGGRLNAIWKRAAA